MDNYTGNALYRRRNAFHDAIDSNNRIDSCFFNEKLKKDMKTEEGLVPELHHSNEVQFRVEPHSKEWVSMAFSRRAKALSRGLDGP
jgi:hypothetical protein